MDQTYAVGQVILQKGDKPVIGPFTLPADATLFACSLDKTLHLHPLVAVVVAIELSRDGGATWQELASQTDIGGQVGLDDDGKPVTTFDQEISLPAEVNKVARQVRVSIHAKDGAFISAGGDLKARKGA